MCGLFKILIDKILSVFGQKTEQGSLEVKENANHNKPSHQQVNKTAM